MSKIEPRKLMDMPPREVLKFWPSMELDIYVFEKVLQGPFDVVEELRGAGIVPSFSRDFKACYPLFIMAAMSHPKIEISANGSNFMEAISRGQMVRKNDITTWRVKDGDIVGYGRTLPESLVKFMICSTFNIRNKDWDAQNGTV